MLSRRHAVFGLAAGAATLAAGHTPQATVTRSGTAFGTIVTLSVTAGDAGAATACITAGFDEIRAIEKACSLFDPESDVSMLNRHGALNHPSPLLREILQLSDHYWRVTRGAFDPTVQALWNAEPNASLVGWRKVEASHDRIALAQRGMGLTFNGIAQGLAADRVLAAISRHGGIEATIDTGELGCRAEAAHRFGVAHPRRPGALVGYISISSGFLATSGDYATSFSADFSHHHIIDPATGYSPHELASVTVLAPTGAAADALATAFMVMGRDSSLRMAEVLAGVEMLLIAKDGTIAMSDGMRQRFQPA
jgi:thiamine biosynthesis lipoprotein